jgi:type II secretory pathway pseudopilin PulG
MRRGRRPPARAAGFTFIGLLIAVMLVGIALAVAGRVAQTEAQREREAQLLFVGHQYRAAIARYMAANGHAPLALEPLVRDETGPVPRHYLRHLYPDPMTGQVDWVLISPPGATGIFGVHSSSIKAPFKVANFDPEDPDFDKATCYRGWRFEVQSRGRRLAPTRRGAPDPSITPATPAAAGDDCPG